MEKNYFIKSTDIQKIVKDMFDYCKKFAFLNKEIIEGYFALYANFYNSCRTNPVLSRKQ